MAKMLRCGLILFAGLLIFCVAAGSVAAEGGSGGLVSPELLEHGRLKILWQGELPIKETESLERLFIVGNRIYALSDRKYMVSLNREKGNVIFSRTVAEAGLPVIGLELYKEKLFSVIGNELVEINPGFGRELSSERMAFGVVSPAARNSIYYYIAGTDRRLHVVRADDMVEMFQVAAENDSMPTSVVAEEDFFVFATDAGNVIGVQADEPRRLWQFEAANGIAGQIVNDGRSLFFASKDTNVYRIDIAGRFIWKRQTEAELGRGPRVTQRVVYQYVRNKGMTAIDKQDGKVMWRVPGGVDLLAEVSGKAYVITKMGELVVMDNRKLKRLYSVNFASVSRYASNLEDSKIYIADRSGRIACLEPIE
jgi:outer membrane protein assembly factor BamB